MSAELDARIIAGTNGAVEAVWSYRAESHLHIVTLTAPDVEKTVYFGNSFDRAKEAFVHTFASEDVPDVFARERLMPAGV